MTSKKLKILLQRYINAVLVDMFTNKLDPSEKPKITVVEILKENISPPYVRIYLHFEPEWMFEFSKNKNKFKEAEMEIKTFLKYISFNPHVAIIWNKEPNYGWNHSPF